MSSAKLLEDLKNHFQDLNQVRNLALNNDKDLLCYLLESSPYADLFKERFFTHTTKALVFNQSEFLTFLDLRLLGGSYTKYLNKIGLYSTEFLKTSNQVVLNFAYKDCVLKGGQSKDEEKTQEIFFNEILAKDEIDMLFAKKALYNFESIGGGGEARTF